jgi:FkbM family methyltransferase
MIKKVLGTTVSRSRKYVAERRFTSKHPHAALLHPHPMQTFYSQQAQDAVLAGLLLPYIRANPKQHWIADVGCNHPEKFSNTLFFEQFLGCRAIGIDPLSEYVQKWKDCRPDAIFENYAVGSCQGEVTLKVVDDGGEKGDMFSSIGSPFKDKIKTKAFQERTVPMTTVTDLLEKHGITELLFCSIDVEGLELEVLEGIDFETIRCLSFCIENNVAGPYGDDQIRCYLQDRGYMFTARIGFLDDVFLHESVVDVIR